MKSSIESAKVKWPSGCSCGSDYEGDGMSYETHLKIGHMVCFNCKKWPCECHMQGNNNNDSADSKPPISNQSAKTSEVINPIQ